LEPFFPPLVPLDLGNSKKRPIFFLLRPCLIHTSLDSLDFFYRSSPTRSRVIAPNRSFLPPLHPSTAPLPFGVFNGLDFDSVPLAKILTVKRSDGRLGEPFFFFLPPPFLGLFFHCWATSPLSAPLLRAPL